MSLSITPVGFKGPTAPEGVLNGCLYVPPVYSSFQDQFQHLLALKENTSQTFASLLSHLEEMKKASHQFVFLYPLPDGEFAKKFAKVMQIKAQEAHCFVPVIEKCEFLKASNLGFTRQISILHGPVVQEHVLVDRDSSQVIFVEEFAKTPNQEVWPGSFAALNRVIELEGKWYFSGNYLYGEEDQAKIQERKEMFLETYVKMKEFAESQDVDAIFARLRAY